MERREGPLVCCVHTRVVLNQKCSDVNMLWGRRLETRQNVHNSDIQKAKQHIYGKYEPLLPPMKNMEDNLGHFWGKISLLLLNIRILIDYNFSTSA